MTNEWCWEKQSRKRDRWEKLEQEDEWEKPVVYRNGDSWRREENPKREMLNFQTLSDENCLF